MINSRRMHNIMLRSIALQSIIALAAYFFLQASETDDIVKILEAEGKAAVIKENVDLAREAALKEAFSKAIEQALGIFIDSKAYMVNEKLLHGSVLTRARGHIYRYELLSERQEGDFFVVRIRAEVKRGELEESVRTVIERESFLLLVYDADTDLPEKGTVSAKICETLTSAGYKVMDFFYDKSKDRLELFRRYQNTPEVVLSDLELRFLVRNIIVGRVSVRAKGRYTVGGKPTPNGPVHVTLADGEFKVINIADNKVVIEKAFSSLKGIDKNGEEAANRAIQVLADRSSGFLLEALDEHYQVGVKKLTLNVQGLKTMPDFQRFSQFLEQLRWVREIKKQEFKPVLSTFEIFYAFKPQYLAQTLEAGYPLRIVKVEDYEISAQVIRAEQPSDNGPAKIENRQLDSENRAKAKSITFILSLVLIIILLTVWLIFKIRR